MSNSRDNNDAPENAQWLRFLPAGDRALTVELDAAMPFECDVAIRALNQSINNGALTGLEETVPSFQAISVYFNPLKTDHSIVETSIKKLVWAADGDESIKGRTWHIPCCYDAEFGEDQQSVAAQLNISVDELIKRHQQSRFTVQVMGFMPGLGYLTGLDESLFIKRLESPRTLVPRGSVSIANGMSVVYPLDSPGGWHLLGRTPVDLFDAKRDPGAIFQAGDTVVFEAIGRNDYLAIRENPPEVANWLANPGLASEGLDQPS